MLVQMFPMISPAGSRIQNLGPVLTSCCPPKRPVYWVKCSTPPVCWKQKLWICEGVDFCPGNDMSWGELKVICEQNALKIFWVFFSVIVDYGRYLLLDTSSWKFFWFSFDFFFLTLQQLFQVPLHWKLFQTVPIVLETCNTNPCALHFVAI